MLDFTWLAQEAKSLHGTFHGLFYSIVTLLLLVGVFLEYFKISLGQVPGFSTLISRAFIASLMLYSFPEFINSV